MGMLNFHLISLILLFRNSFNISKIYSTEYTGPSPAAFSGPHRFMIFAYVQTNSYITAPLPEFRSRFVLMDWLKSFGGEAVIRGPVASVGFISEF